MDVESTSYRLDSDPIVSVVKIRDDDIGAAVEEAIDLLGGVEEVAQGKQRIMLKPNLVTAMPQATTNPKVVGALARPTVYRWDDIRYQWGVHEIP